MMSDELKELMHGIAEELGYSDPSLTLRGSPDRLVREMDEAGIDKTVLLALDTEFALREKVSYRYHNDYVARALKEFPDRFIGFAGIDPRRGKEAIAELERCVGDFGFRGVKLWPQTGFYPDDIAFYAFYERVEELGVSILCHTGTSPAMTYMKYNQPVYVDKVAVDFPKINIIMAHIGRPWTSEAIALAAKNPNVYVDISSWQVALRSAPYQFFQTLGEAKMMCRGVQKILLGSDWPFYERVLSLRDWVGGIKAMKMPQPLQTLGLREFKEEDKKMILGGNAARVLRL
jgi:hypothetical protein